MNLIMFLLVFWGRFSGAWYRHIIFTNVFAILDYRHAFGYMKRGISSDIFTEERLVLIKQNCFGYTKTNTVIYVQELGNEYLKKSKEKKCILIIICYYSSVKVVCKCALFKRLKVASLSSTTLALDLFSSEPHSSLLEGKPSQKA